MKTTPKIVGMLILTLLIAQVWSLETPIVTAAGDDRDPSILRLSNGFKVVAFSSDSGIQSFDVFMMIDRGTGWGQPFLAEMGGFADSRVDTVPDLVELSGNRIMVIWSQCLGSNCDIVYNIYNVTDSSWDPEGFTILIDDGSRNTRPSAILMPSGSICVFWQSNQLGGARPNDIFYVCFPEDWQYPLPTPVMMPHSSSTVNEYNPSATLKDGLVWLAWDRDNNDIYLTVNSTGWAPPIQLTSDTNLDLGASLTATGDGQLWLFWETDRDSGGSPELNIYYKRSYDPLNINSWLPDTRLTRAAGNDRSPSGADVQPGTVGIVFTSNRDGAALYDIYYTTIVRKSGDTDWDGDVDIDDLIGTYLAQFSTAPTNLYRYDVDQDGDIDLDDLILVFLRQFT